MIERKDGVTKIWPVDPKPRRDTRVNVELIVKALRYYGKNHSRERSQVKEELENWEKEMPKPLGR